MEYEGHCEAPKEIFWSAEKDFFPERLWVTGQSSAVSELNAFKEALETLKP